MYLESATPNIIHTFLKNDVYGFEVRIRRRYDLESMSPPFAWSTSLAG
jgi:hypothetical protein